MIPDIPHALDRATYPLFFLGDYEGAVFVLIVWASGVRGEDLVVYAREREREEISRGCVCVS